MTKRERTLWIAAYALVMIGLLTALLSVRKTILATMNTTQARADWNAWRETAEKQSSQGPVRRRVPKSTEPPALVLMRDYFMAVAVGGVVFGTLLFIVVGWTARGALAKR